MELKRQFENTILLQLGLGLSVICTFMKTKFLVPGHGVTEEDQQPIVTSGGNVECVSEFTYVGSQMTSDGNMDTEVEKRIAAASRAFGTLRHAVFWNRPSHQETCAPGMCTQCTILSWRRISDTV